jgi:hypothetical protein
VETTEEYIIKGKQMIRLRIPIAATAIPRGMRAKRNQMVLIFSAPGIREALLSLQEIIS